MIFLKRNPIVYISFIIIVMILGVSSRIFGEYLPLIISKYSGDVLWALMVYLGFGFILSKGEIKKVVVASIIFSYGIEISQLYQAPWINAIRDTTIGALILGHGFLFSDLICYTIGVLIGVVLEYIFLIRKK